MNLNPETCSSVNSDLGPLGPSKLCEVRYTTSQVKAILLQGEGDYTNCSCQSGLQNIFFDQIVLCPAIRITE